MTFWQEIITLTHPILRGGGGMKFEIKISPLLNRKLSPCWGLNRLPRCPNAHAPTIELTGLRDIKNKLLIICRICMLTHQHTPEKTMIKKKWEKQKQAFKIEDQKYIHANPSIWLSL